MKYLAAIVLMVSAPVWADSNSGSMSKSCSGRVRVCRPGTIYNPSNCPEEYFYAYAYQYAYVYNGEVRSESHSFSFSGALDKEEKATVSYAEDNQVFYDGRNWDLKIPYDDDAPIEAKQRNIRGARWQVLCR
ncbi:hypothetical protein K2X33_14205 [bacterium]|nr:hypothetical protein [bacterium]